jgi:hypothetical protein
VPLVLLGGRRRRDGTTTFFTAAQNVRFWHKADIARLSSNVRYWGESGHRADKP